jgi:molybdopterin synthase sulfur carrier subunit
MIHISAPSPFVHLAHPAVRPSGKPVVWAHVLFFGKVADRFGRTREVAMPLAGCSLSQIKAQLALDVEGGAEALGGPGLRMAVDQVLCLDGAWVTPGQEVAFFSMFSGG